MEYPNMSKDVGCLRDNKHNNDLARHNGVSKARKVTPGEEGASLASVWTGGRRSFLFHSFSHHIHSVFLDFLTASSGGRDEGGDSIDIFSSQKWPRV